MINEQLFNLLTSGAAIVTIISGLNSFFGKKYISFSKVFFQLSIYFLMLIFIKEILFFFYKSLPCIALLSVIVITYICLSNRRTDNFNKQTIVTSLIIAFTLVATVFQKDFLSSRIADYGFRYTEYIDNLYSLDKVVEIYKFIFSSNNVIFTFSSVFNIVIIFMCFSLIKRIIDYLNDKDFQLDKITCYSIFLFVFSCGLGTVIMSEIVKKF